MIEIERTGTGKNIYSEYYEAAAAIAQPRHFPSPVNDTKWIKSATEWFVESQTAMEVGPGRGEFAEAVVKNREELKKYCIVDMSRGMLNLTHHPSIENKIFNECGFEIISETPVILPKDVWMTSVAAQGKEHANPGRLEFIDKLGGYPSSVDIIAKPLTNQRTKGGR